MSETGVCETTRSRPAGLWVELVGGPTDSIVRICPDADDRAMVGDWSRCNKEQLFKLTPEPRLRAL
jgi:hypothetical protein